MNFDHLVCLYRFIGNGLYEITYLFDDEGLIDEGLIFKFYKEYSNREITDYGPGYVAPFEGLDRLQKFCFHLCQELKKEQVNLFDPDEYLNIFNQSTDVNEFKKYLFDSGNVLVNPEKEKGGSLFGKIFS